MDIGHTPYYPHMSYVPVPKSTNDALLDICKAVLYYKDIYARGYYKPVWEKHS
jgi:hypothetical protein